MRLVKFPVWEDIEISFDESEMPSELLNGISEHPEEIKAALIKKITEAKPISLESIEGGRKVFKLVWNTGRFLGT